MNLFKSRNILLKEETKMRLIQDTQNRLFENTNKIASG